MRRVTILFWVFVLAGLALLALEWRLLEAEGAPGGLGAAVLAISLVAAAAFVWAMLRARVIAERAGLRGYRWSNLWTAVTVIIPFLNLIRPWLGFSEIARSLRGAAVTGELGDAWRRDRRADTATFLLWLLVLLSFVLGVMVSVMVTGANVQGDTAAGTQVLAVGQSLGFWLDVALVAGGILYLHGIRRDLRRVVALATDPFR